MAWLTIKLKSTTKRNHGQPANNAIKQAKNWGLNAYDIWTIPLL